MKKFKLTDFHYCAIQELLSDPIYNLSEIEDIDQLTLGLKVLECLGASYDTFCGYCMYPVVQTDKALNNYLSLDSEVETVLYDHAIPVKSMVLAMEFRKCNRPDSFSYSNIIEVNNILIANTIQRKIYCGQSSNVPPRFAQEINERLQLLKIDDSMLAKIKTAIL